MPGEPAQRIRIGGGRLFVLFDVPGIVVEGVSFYQPVDEVGAG